MGFKSFRQFLSSKRENMVSYLIKISSFVLITFSLVAVNGIIENLQAATTLRSIVNLSHKNNEDHVWNLSPTAGASSSHFLEIYWYFFSVHGTMPKCENDYVEVKLTRLYLGAGRFCSNNLGQYKPFTMYSLDGYAQIHYHSDSADIGSGFVLSYKLLNSSHLSSDCVNTNNKQRSGIIYSPGWPISYASHSVPCLHKISAGADRETKLIFIDVDLNHKGAIPSCSSFDDYVEVRGTNSSLASFETSSTISGKICGTATHKELVTRSQYIYIHFNRNLGSHSTQKRGYFSGYISYDIQATKDTVTITQAATTAKATTMAPKIPTTATMATTTTSAAATTTESKMISKGLTITGATGQTAGWNHSPIYPIPQPEPYFYATICLAVVVPIFFIILLIVKLYSRRKKAGRAGPPELAQPAHELNNEQRMPGVNFIGGPLPEVPARADHQGQAGEAIATERRVSRNGHTNRQRINDAVYLIPEPAAPEHASMPLQFPNREAIRLYDRADGSIGHVNEGGLGRRGNQMNDVSGNDAARVNRRLAHIFAGRAGFINLAQPAVELNNDQSVSRGGNDSDQRANGAISRRPLPAFPERADLRGQVGENEGIVYLSNSNLDPGQINVDFSTA